MFVVEELTLEPEGKIAPEIVGLENDEPFGSQEVHAERSECVGVCSTDEGVGSMLESHKSVAAKGEEPRYNPTVGLNAGKLVFR